MEILDHYCLSLGKAMKLRVAIMMGLLISLLRDDTRLRIWSEQSNLVHRGHPRNSDLRQTLFECFHFTLTGLHGTFKSLHKPLGQPIRREVVRCGSNVLNPIPFHKLSKFIRGEPSAII